MGSLVCQVVDGVHICVLTVVLRLRRDYPSYINVPTLLIDVVSVMGKQPAFQFTNDHLTRVCHSRLYPRGIVSRA